MNILQLLTEEVYDPDKVDELASIYMKKTEGKSQITFEMTDDFRRLFNIPKSISVVVIYYGGNLDGGSGQVRYANSRTDNGTRSPVIQIQMKKTTGMNKKKSFKHEVIHVLDYAKNFKKNKIIKQPTQKRNVSFDYLTYKKDHMELNQIVNFINMYKDKAYDTIETMGELVKWAMIKTASQKPSDMLKAGYYRDFLKQAAGDKDLGRKLVRRLNREGLLPKAFNASA